MECLVCGGRESRRCFTAREQQFGTNEPFEYFECRACRSLQIGTIPPDLGRYYPSGYYSMIAADEPIVPLSRLKRFVRAARTDYYINRVNPIGWAIGKYAHKYYDLSWEWFRGYASTRSRILDVGCGYGDLLRRRRARSHRGSASRGSPAPQPHRPAGETPSVRACQRSGVQSSLMCGKSTGDCHIPRCGDLVINRKHGASASVL